MKGILVLGAGGHGKVVADILQTGNAEVIGFLDDDPMRWNTVVFDLPVLGGIDQYAEYRPDGLIFGIGSNQVRKAIAERLGQTAIPLWRSAIHPSATVARSVRLGHGVVVCAHAVINPDAEIGDHGIINTAATIDHDCKLGYYVHLAPGTHLAGNVVIGEGVLMGIGSQAIPSTEIGAWAVVGAGATVIYSIPESVTAKGTPARW
jgi:sugar O-acyltransferase (sialic acid O-acetyltransferase NeuD family)